MRLTFYRIGFFSITLMMFTFHVNAMDQISSVPPSNQLGPVYDYDSYSILADNDPNIVVEVNDILQNWSKLTTSPQPIQGKYWQRRYHRQVNEQVFQVVRYPFYATGETYAQAVTPPTPEPSADPNAAAANASIHLARYRLEQIFDLIHQWRNINESEAAALEIRYAIELTKTTTRVYQINPDLAIQVKRTLGRIGRTNTRFDRVSRQALESLLKNDSAAAIKSRLEKQLADLQTLFDRLAETNDAISQTLGIGPIKRITAIPDYLDTIDYSAKRLPEPITATNR